MPDPQHWKEKRPDVQLSRTITITATRPDLPLLVRNVTSSFKDLKLELETVEKDKRYAITATWPKRLTQAVTGTISFETNLASLPKVDIPAEVNLWRD